MTTYKVANHPEGTYLRNVTITTDHKEQLEIMVIGELKKSFENKLLCLISVNVEVEILDFSRPEDVNP